MRQLISILLILAMLLTGVAALAEPAVEVENNAPVMYTHDGRVTLIDGACVDTPVNGMEDAAAVVKAVLEALGGDAGTALEPWRTLTDAYGKWTMNTLSRIRTSPAKRWRPGRATRPAS